MRKDFIDLENNYFGERRCLVGGFMKTKSEGRLYFITTNVLSAKMEKG